jgi:hypothetical protein
MKRGDHVYVDRVLYEHHGIAVSPWQVIHYGAEPGQSMVQAKICLATVEEFALGLTVRVRPYPGGFLPERTVSRAESKLGTGDYDLFGRNCEHFASWCVTGEATSDQVGRNVRLALGALSMVAERFVPQLGMAPELIGSILSGADLGEMARRGDGFET